MSFVTSEMVVGDVVVTVVGVFKLNVGIGSCVLGVVETTLAQEECVGFFKLVYLSSVKDPIVAKEE